MQNDFYKIANKCNAKVDVKFLFLYFRELALAKLYLLLLIIKNIINDTFFNYLI